MNELEKELKNYMKPELKYEPIEMGDKKVQKDYAGNKDYDQKKYKQ